MAVVGAHKHLSPVEANVWLLLFRDTKPDGLARTSSRNLAQRAGCSLRAVSHAMKLLKSATLVEVVTASTSRGSPSVFRVSMRPQRCEERLIAAKAKQQRNTVATISTVAGRTVEINDTNRGNHCHNPRKRREQSVSLTAAACHPAQQTMVFRCDVACRFLLFATSARATSRSTAASGPHMVTQRSRTLRDATTRATTHGHADGHARPPPRRVDAGGCRGRRKNLAQPSTHTPAIVAKSKGTSAGVWRLRPA